MKNALTFRVGGDSLEGCWKLAGGVTPGYTHPQHPFAPAGAMEIRRVFCGTEQANTGYCSQRKAKVGIFENKRLFNFVSPQFKRARPLTLSLSPSGGEGNYFVEEVVLQICRPAGAWFRSPMSIYVKPCQPMSTTPRGVAPMSIKSFSIANHRPCHSPSPGGEGRDEGELTFADSCPRIRLQTQARPGKPMQAPGGNPYKRKKGTRP
jgi:hypothetical protein